MHSFLTVTSFLHSEILLSLSSRVSLKRTRWSELTQLVPHHIFRDIDGEEGLAIVDIEVQTNKVWCDRRTARPCLNRLAIIVRLSRLYLLCQVSINKKTFLIDRDILLNYLRFIGRPLRRTRICELVGLDFLRVGNPLES